MKHLSFIKNVFHSIKEEIVVSLGLVLALTVVLSAIFYWVESEAQPDVFVDYSDAFVWAYTRYIEGGDGVFDGGPVTVIGKVIASLFGFIGIAIVAIPAGLVGSGFIDAMTEEKTKITNETNARKIKEYFDIDCNTWQNENFWPARFERVSRLQSKLHLSFDKIIDAIESDDELRLINFAESFPDESKGDPMAVERIHVNTDYGYCSGTTKASNVLIVTMVSASEAGTSYFGYHLSRIGRFNHVSNDFMRYDAPNEDNRCICIGVYDDLRASYPKLNHYVEDILRLSDEDTWIIVLAKTSKETMMRLAVGGGPKDDPFVASASNTVRDVAQFKEFYNELSAAIQGDEITTDCRVMKSKETYLTKWLHNNNRHNVFEIDFNREFLYRKRDGLITLAKMINKHFERRNQYGLNLLPMSGLPVYKGREAEAMRLAMKANNYYVLHYEPIDIEDAKPRTLCFATDFPMSLDGEPKGMINLTNECFDDSQKEVIVEKSYGKQTTFKRQGKSAFTFEGRKRSLLKAGKYKCTLTHYSSEIFASYEFNKKKKRFENGAFADNPFDGKKLCMNVEQLNCPEIPELDGKRVIHTDELLYDGLVVEGQVFIADKDNKESRTFEWEYVG